MLNSSILVLFFEYFFTLSAHLSSTFVWEVVNISLPTLTYCKYDVIWRPPYEAKKHNFYTFINESAQFVSNI
jgi:hypothetical protein